MEAQSLDMKSIRERYPFNDSSQNPNDEDNTRITPLYQ